MQHERERIKEIMRETGVMRPRDLASLGISRMALQRLYERGELLRSGRGLYTLADAEPTESVSLVEACKRVPHGVICLLSALRFHQLGTQNPSQVWMAIHPKKHRPQRDYPPLRVVRFSGLALSEGIEEHRTENGLVRVYGVAKTVADCFRYRNKIGLDVALEALRECRRERLVTLDELWHFAEADRIATVMKPYLEAIA
jgi:predicted transcriptional regulator of viral defense system